MSPAIAVASMKDVTTGYRLERGRDAWEDDRLVELGKDLLEFLGAP